MNIHDKAATTPGISTVAKLMLEGKACDMPVRSGTVGPDVIDVAKLYKDTGCFTYDPGFTSTANCVSRITYIDGDAGILLYRGYPIDQLAQDASFLETCYLLFTGNCPPKNSTTSSRRPSRTTRWFMSR